MSQKDEPFKPLDFVLTPEGSVAIIDEVNPAGNGLPYQYSVSFIHINKINEKNAWWQHQELKYLTNLPQVLAEKMAHPFSSHGRSEARKAFKRDDK